MALTVFETTEQQLLPCQQQQGAGAGDAGNGNGKAAAAAAAPGVEKAAAAMLKETDHGGNDDDPRPARDDIWNMIQAQKPPPPPRQAQAQAPYVHPLVRRSSSLLTQKSLEICTESLGSETGSDGFSDADAGSATPGSDDGRQGAGEEDEMVAPRAAAAAPPTRAFPPPLPSLARRKVESTMEMRQERQDGRLLVKVVPVASSTLFRAQRRGGRLLLSFADTAAPAADELDRKPAEAEQQQQQPHPQQQAEEEDEEEDEVEVVDRGTVVEVKVSAQPQARSGSGSGSRPRVHRSALVINKFVGAEPVTSCEIDDAPQHPAAAAAAAAKPPRRSTGSTTTAVAALAAASALSATAAPPDNGDDGVPGATCGEHKLLMTAKRHSSKEELMKRMRRCSGQLSPSLFVWEGCIATSS